MHTKKVKFLPISKGYFCFTTYGIVYFTKNRNKDFLRNKFMEIGKIYDIVFLAGAYNIDYENNAKCIKITKKLYKIERKDGSTRD